MTKKILIFKFGHMGDVVRTTPILRLFKNDRVYWVTDEKSMPIFKYVTHKNLQVIPFDYEKTYSYLKKLGKFDRVINFDEDRRGAAIAELFKYKKTYSSVRFGDAWIAMGIDNNLKRKNKKTYQWHMFKALGKQFRGEKYVFDYPVTVTRPVKKVIGIETRVGKDWPTKGWTRDQWDSLIAKIKKSGLKVIEFNDETCFPFDNLVAKIAMCDIIISPDTLTMHLAIALNKPTIVLFTCTSAPEIYDYGLVRKVVAEVPCKCSYQRECLIHDVVCAKAITVDSIMAEIGKVLINEGG